MGTRRDFLEVAAAASLAGSLASAAADREPRKRIAIITTLWAYLRHGQHIGDRFLVGYPWQGDWHHPPLDVVSAFVAQVPTAADLKSREAEFGFPQGDLSRDRAREFGFSIQPTIAGALRCGGSKLAVDGVVIIAEHGDYPANELGQTLYPRYEFFRQVVEVFERDGRSVPVFNDKHLSYSFRQASRMVADSKRLDFPMLAGSSLPVTWRMPEVDVPYGERVTEAVGVGVGSLDSSGFHALEALQCLVERRRGGETGIESVQLLEGDAVWQAGKTGRWSHNLLAAALSRADVIKGITLTDARPQDLAATGVLESIVPNPAAFLVEYRDGLKTSLLMLNGAVGDFTAAVRIRDQSEPVSTKFLLPPEPNVAYSACLVHHIEDMITSGRAPYPVERTLLVSGLLESALASRQRENVRIATPHLDVRYKAPRKSTFPRG